MLRNIKSQNIGAENLNTGCQLTLGLIYTFKDVTGLEQDFVSALKWFLIAEKNSQPDELIALLQQREMLGENNENLPKE